MGAPSSQSLRRTLGLFPVTSIVIANMIGAGIFTTSGLLMGDLKNPLLMIALWLGGGIIALCGALCYGELGIDMPHAGGEYVFLSRLYHPLLGFLSGWVSFIVGFSAPIAASSIGFSEYFTRAFPQIHKWCLGSGFLTPGLLNRSLSIIIILLFTFIHLRGIQFGARIQNYLTGLKVVLIIGLVGCGFFFGKGEMSHFLQGEGFCFNFSGFKTMGLGLMWIMFAYSGWNAAIYIGAEIKKPGVNLPRSLLIGTGAVMVLYVLLNVLYIYAVPPHDMGGVISVAGLAVGRLFGASLETPLSLLISFALFSSISAFIILGPRVYYSMARDGYLFKFISDVDPDRLVPSKAIVLQGALSIVMVLSGTFDQILTYMGFSLGIFPILAVMGVYRLRKRQRATYPLSHVVPVVYIFSGLMMLGLAYFQRPVESSVAIVTVVTGIPVFYFFRNRYF